MLFHANLNQKLLLAITLTVLITGSILAFSVQEAYSQQKNFNSAKDVSAGGAISQLRADLMDLKSNLQVYLDGNNVESYIDIMLMELDEVQTGVDEMDEFFSVMNDELQSLKQGLNSDSNEVAIESTTQTTESATEKGAYSNITLERIDFANGFVVLDDLQNVAPKLHQSVCTAQGSCETLFNDSWVIVVSKSMLGDTTSDKLEEYLKVTLSDTRIATIVENERTGISGLGQDDLLTKAAVAPELQPKDIKSIVPPWVRYNAGWYAEGLITEVEFVKGLEWMINNGVIEIQNLEEIVKK